ncbi:hypothetical protein PF003_g14602 [Phytophthora fragariae]|nr:hypothetical protein PF003_g14602 [Phytophthora fragariae]
MSLLAAVEADGRMAAREWLAQPVSWTAVLPLASVGPGRSLFRGTRIRSSGNLLTHTHK